MKLIAFIRLIRPINLLLTAFAVILGGALVYLNGSDMQLTVILLSTVSASLIAAGTYALNDVLDVVEDSINTPERALPAGLLGTATAKYAGWLFIVIGNGISLFLGIKFILFSSVITLILQFYIYKLKATPLLGNLTVSITAAASFLFGALAGGDIQQGFLPAMLAAPVHFIREIIKDVEDYHGDRHAGKQTFPLVTSANVALRISGFLMFIIAVAIPLPYFSGHLSLFYLIVAGLFVALPLAFWSGSLIALPERIPCRKLQKLVKWVMLPGMAAIFLGSWLK